MRKFSISIIIPTLNSEDTIKLCLDSIRKQKYPRNLIEIIIVDAGSIDNTLSFVKKYNVKIYANKLKTGEAGKAIGLKYANNQLIALIDSDNILPDQNWFNQMTEPFKNNLIIGSEPIKYSYRKSDGFIDRYCALMGMNDPLCFFLGNYDRYNYLKNKWTDLDVLTKDYCNWIEIHIERSKIPTIGANGTLYRSSFLKKHQKGKFLFDIDILAKAITKKPILFAKVKIGIIHKYCGSNIKSFINKQTRRIYQYLYYKDHNLRLYDWGNIKIYKYFFFILSTIFVFPLFIQSIKGYVKKSDIAWFFHPLACIITLYIYMYYFLLNIMKKSVLYNEEVIS